MKDAKFLIRIRDIINQVPIHLGHDLEIGQRSEVRTRDGVEIRGVRQHRPVPPIELVLAENRHLRDREMPGDDQTPEDIREGVIALLTEGDLRTREQHRFPKILKHKTKIRGSVGHSLGTQQDDEPIISRIILLDDSRNLLDPLALDTSVFLLRFVNLKVHPLSKMENWGDQEVVLRVKVGVIPIADVDVLLEASQERAFLAFVGAAGVVLADGEGSTDVDYQDPFLFNLRVLVVNLSRELLLILQQLGIRQPRLSPGLLRCLRSFQNQLRYGAR